MEKIIETLIEPQKLYTGSMFKLKIKVIKNIIYTEIAQISYDELKKFTYNQLKGGVL